MKVERSAEKALDNLLEHAASGDFIEVRRWHPNSIRKGGFRQASVARPPAALHHGRVSVGAVDKLESAGYLVRDRALEQETLTAPLYGIERRALRLTALGAMAAAIARTEQPESGLASGSRTPEDEALAASRDILVAMNESGLYEALREARSFAAGIALDGRSEYSARASEVEEKLEEALRALERPVDGDGERDVLSAARRFAAAHEGSMRRLADGDAGESG